MSIECFADTYTPTCDMCGAELSEEFSFEDAVESKKLHGWRSVYDATGEWWDLCPDCYRKHANRLRSSAASDFGGIA